MMRAPWGGGGGGAFENTLQQLFRIMVQNNSDAS
jgi:hypothetical protein